MAPQLAAPALSDKPPICQMILNDTTGAKQQLSVQVKPDQPQRTAPRPELPVPDDPAYSLRRMLRPRVSTEDRDMRRDLGFRRTLTESEARNRMAVILQGIESGLGKK